MKSREETAPTDELKYRELSAESDAKIDWQ